MVQQYQSPVRVYKHPFALVMMAYERRFPTCPQIPVFIGCEVMLDEESKDGAVRTTERRCKLNVEAPYILKKIIGVDFVYFIQRNILDRRNNVLEIEAYNESFSSRVTVIEKCRYFIHPENPDWTCFEQTASLDIRNFFGFENSMEKLAMKQYAQNIAKGKEIIEFFINQLKEEGITYVSPWKDSQEKSPEEEKKNMDENNELYSDKELCNVDSKLPSNREMQLSSDYIERYLGKLDMLQESKLVQLRHSIEELRGSSVPGYATLLRFLRAAEFSVEKAREMLTHSLHWRKKHQIDKLLDEYEMPQVTKDYFPGGWHHFDKDGRPLYILRLGQMDVKGLLKSIGEDELLLLALHICEEGLHLMEEATTVWGHPVSQWTLLIDLEGLNMRHLWRPGIKALLRIIEIVEANYPETMGRVLIIRAPRCFPILWTLISTFINENTRKKFIFYCGTDYQEQGSGGLSEYINQEFVPDFLGGSSETYIMDGGVVPKNLYRLDLEGTTGEHEHSLYHSISLSRGQTHHVFIESDDPGAVLTWDFDVMRHNVVFTVLHKSRNSGNGAIAEVSELAVGGDHDIVIAKELKDNFVKVESSVVCHDGESIQGTHIMQDAGTYVLQWQNQEDQTEFLPSISSHKAQLMYFYETLPSAHYRGSMMSLQSAISGRSEASSSLSR
ncbi:protein real-time isoform X2 [Harpegnathos saltator]|uniref:Protein real-time n=1 Tax=Harpegnathos saltator TaxID=610380 RepID=E2BK52_HARSA|nr:protein real-time isoform X2 [Harpegnathos saltator]EFN83960.1 Protein real-time [Harpegnathos saltator]